MVNGAVEVSQIRPVEIQDLLGREPVSLETGRIRELVQGKVVMVTGAGGSIGSDRPVIPLAASASEWICDGPQGWTEEEETGERKLET